MQLATPNSIQPFRSPAALTVSAQTGGATASSSASGSPSNSGTSTASITANDFLQLLVTELQNQDPTANTDPNEYVNQLVQVNTLQQQIQMNQTLDGGPTLTGGSNGVLQELAQMNQVLQGDLSYASPSQTVAQSAALNSASSGTGKVIPSANTNQGANTQVSTAAEAVATALTHRPQSASAGPHMSALDRFAANLKAKPR